MNPANYREALIETEADEAEGADILLVNLNGGMNFNIENFTAIMVSL